MDTQNPQNAAKALKPMPKAKAKGGAKSKRLNTLKSWLLAPSTLGLLVSLFVWISAYKFYSYKALNDPQIKEPVISKLVEWLDEKAIDARFQLRGEQKVVAPVALLAIDDRSVEEVGRWPWSREKIAFVIDKMMKYGAKAIGFDIVFSEPQEDYSANSLKKIYEESKGISTLPAQFSSDLLSETTKSQPDQILADTITKYADKLVLGSFIANSEGGMRPYQDYCRNEVFKATPAGSIIKFNNVSFVVNDEADPFVDLNFDGLFKQIFESLDFHSTESALKKLFNKSSVTQLTPIELQRLKYILHDDKVKYCNRWLDQDDEFFEPAIGAYKQIFAKSPLLKPLLDNLANSKSTSPAEARQQMEPVIAAFKAAVKTHPVSQDNDWTINTAKIQDAATYTACFVAEQDQDGTIRKNSPFFRTGNKIGLSFVPSLALQTYLVATGYRALVEINNDPRNPKQKVISQFSIQDPNKDSDSELFSVPVDERGKMQINYAGGRNMYAYLSAKELFSDSEDAEITQSTWDESTKSWRSATSKVKKADFIKDKAFIFGATAIGIYDLRVTPFEKNFPGPETHLNTMANLFDQNFLRRAPKEQNYMLVGLAILGIFFSFALAHSGAIVGFAVSSVVGAILFGLDQYFFRHGIITTMALPGLLLGLLYLSMTFYKYFTEERKKKHLRTTFSKYVSPAIVDEILKDPENIELGGKKQHMTVFFSDVRGFTTISEKLDPQVLSDVLNRYLTPMTQIVFANKGTLDKYMGDALMAFFGAPIFFADHAEHGCRCALQSIEKLHEIQLDFAKQGLPNIDIGIGLNSADMSVGNMGSDIVRSYTVMGDAVNLGSRLEGINKEYGTRIIISQFTKDLIKDKFVTREVDWVRVKGKYEPVRIYELIKEGAPDPKLKQFLDLFGSAFKHYHDKDFAKALSDFETSLTIKEGDPVSTLYIERCQDYIQNPPPQEWDGVFVMKTK